MNKVKRCTRCVMDSSIPDISFNENGICNYCLEYEYSAQKLLSSREERSQALNRIIDKIKKNGKNKQYDCIIGVSGGVDSTYVAYLTKEYGLRPLAVHFDNGWNSELAVSNIEKALNKLGIDLYTHVVDWEEFKDLQLSFLKSSVTNIEVPTDHAITAILYDQAGKENIKHIIFGNNLATEGIQASNWGEYNKDLKLIKSIHKRFGKKKLKTFPQISLKKFAYYTFIKGVKHIAILDYVDYNKNEAMNILQEKLDWKNYGGKHYESVFTRFFQGYILPEKFGVDKRLGHLSTLIMSGQISRDEALEELNEPIYPEELLDRDKEFFINKFGLTESEFESIMCLPIKSGKDYPSHEWIFNNLNFLIELGRKIAKS